MDFLYLPIISHLLWLYVVSIPVNIASVKGTENKLKITIGKSSTFFIPL